MPPGSRSHPQIGFEEIEHTADRALKIYGQNLAQLLRNAARGLNSLMGADEQIKATPIKKLIELDAVDAESLLVEWLNELTFWAETEMLIFTKYDLQNITPTHVRALIFGNRVTHLEKQVKAVTYHYLKIVESEKGLAATVVFDV